MIRVLVVDDDPTAQKVMRHFLERCGYDPVICANGRTALAIAQSPEAPPIVILDWMMPGMDGLAVCRALRTSKLKHRPYVILFSTKSDKSEIAEGLDAGADDFVCKPFNVPEMQARLRVACRSIEYQRELQDHIDEIEALNQRNALLAELITKERSRKESRNAGTPPSHGSALSAAGAQGPLEFSIQDLAYVVSSSVLELHLAVESLKPHPGHIDTETPGCYALTSLVVQSQGLWLDLLIAAHSTHAGMLFEKTFGRKSRSTGDLAGYLAEFARTIGNGFARTLATRSGDTLQPLMPRAFHSESNRSSLPLPAECKAYDLVVDDCPLRLALATHPGSKLNVAPTQLQPLDILVDNFPPASVSRVPLLRAGAVLTPRVIEKIAYEIESLEGTDRADVFRPSPLAKYFSQQTKST